MRQNNKKVEGSADRRGGEVPDLLLMAYHVDRTSAKAGHRADRIYLQDRHKTNRQLVGSFGRAVQRRKLSLGS